MNGLQFRVGNKENLRTGRKSPFHGAKQAKMNRNAVQPLKARNQNITTQYSKAAKSFVKPHMKSNQIPQPQKSRGFPFLGKLGNAEFVIKVNFE